MIKEWRDFIKSDPAVMMGKPVITGTRVTVELILEKLAAGETPEQRQLKFLADEITSVTVRIRGKVSQR